MKMWQQPATFPQAIAAEPTLPPPRVVQTPRRQRNTAQQLIKDDLIFKAALQFIIHYFKIWGSIVIKNTL